MIVGRKYRDPVLFDDMPGLKIRPRHPDAQLFGLVAPGDYAAVIIAEHHHGLIPEIGAEYPLAGTIKTIAIDDRIPLASLRREFMSLGLVKEGSMFCAH
jgi:hypothetical protein